jgi:hypothetical protein
MSIGRYFIVAWVATIALAPGATSQTPGDPFPQGFPLTAILEGTVSLRPFDDPLSGVRVLLSEPRVGGLVLEVSSDRDGRFVFENVPLGRYTLRSDAIGFRQAAFRIVEREATARGGGTRIRVDTDLPRTGFYIEAGGRYSLRIDMERD